MKKNSGRIYTLAIVLTIGLFIFLLHIYIVFPFTLISMPAKFSGSSQTFLNYSIIIVTPPDLPEQQESQYRCMVISNLGGNCYIFKYKDISDNQFYARYISTLQKVINFAINPDFIMYLYPEMLFEDNNYINYGVLDIAHVKNALLNKSEDIACNLDWISYFDGFIVYGDNKEWLNQFISNAKKVNPNITANYLLDYYPSIYATEYYQSNKNILFYSGSNWDPKRGSKHYQEIFKLLDVKDYFRAYGPQKSWVFLNRSYKGMIEYNPFDFIRKMQESGIALLFHSDYHITYAIPSMRIFEAAAASNVIISDKHPFIRREFGDCVYYIDPTQDSHKVAGEIDHIVRLMQANPKLANEKARCAHDVFIRKFTLEDQLGRVIEMHKRIANNWEKL